MPKLQLSPLDKKRVGLLRLAKSNPGVILHVIDEIKEQAVDVLRETLKTAEPQVVAELEQRVKAAFEQYSLQTERMLKAHSEQFLKDLDEKIEKEVDKVRVIKGEKGDQGNAPSVEFILELIKPLIPQVRDGATPTTEQLQTLIKPIVEAAVENVKPTIEEKAEKDKEFDDKLAAAIQKGIADEISKIKRFGGGGGTGVNLVTIRGITTGGVGERKLTGAIDGSNAVFTTPRTFKKGGETVYHNGVRLREGSDNDYTVGNGVTKTITFNTAPLTDDIIVVDIDAGY